MIRVCRHNLRNCRSHTPNIVAVFITDAPAKRSPRIYRLSKSDKPLTAVVWNRKRCNRSTAMHQFKIYQEH
jgi:hypothetical protein